ncbi:segregation/condensation protein A [Lactococcus protaetiae]|uniref:Segregation and condensation protein A n=1 Tax=Lactococcus protaetiae TaxID=2592653 RepID=A0A514Z9R6_9LACT|nr:segregation/condensation protein A [Lactococcus protaetiae]QDK71320.1 segregation/condensation protein A [Lactococcus protaetiae]
MIEEINIKIDNFEGPLDLLLHLVSQYQMDIFQVPLVPVIEQYLNYIRKMQTLELEIAGEYMLMASQLMLIKSRRLLPTISDDFIEDTEQLEYDLLAQIDEYRKYKMLSQSLNNLHTVRSHYYSKSKTEIITDETSLIKDKNAIDLFLAFNKILELQRQQIEDENTTIEAEKYTIADKILELTKKFTKQKICKFSSLFSKDAKKEELVTTFMALLELIKNQQISFSQEELFGEIILERKGELKY